MVFLQLWRGHIGQPTTAQTLDLGEIMAAEFTKETFESEVLGADTPVLVDFWSDG
jgi:thioredoxin-like negative regulator of GroEL